MGVEGKCIDSMGHFYKEMGLYGCNYNKKHPGGSQFYFLGHNRDLEYYSDSAYCIDAGSNKLELHACHHKQGGQYFRYDIDTQQMKHRPNEKNCMEADAGASRVYIKPCDNQNINQKWKWGSINEENLRNWEGVGAKIL